MKGAFGIQGDMWLMKKEFMNFFKKEDANILVVDDDRGMADTLVEYLSQLGYSATAAYGGREGLSRFEGGDFQLVITDLMMPEMDGMVLLETIKRLDSRAMVIVVTGYGTIESAVGAIQKGAYDFIPKPFKMEELKIIVERAMERHTIRRQLSMFRGLILALIISVPLWLILVTVLALVWK